MNEMHVLFVLCSFLSLEYTTTQVFCVYSRRNRHVWVLYLNYNNVFSLLHTYIRYTRITLLLHAVDYFAVVAVDKIGGSF